MMELNEQAAVDTVVGNFWTGLGCGFGIVASIAVSVALYFRSSNTTLSYVSRSVCQVTVP